MLRTVAAIAIALTFPASLAAPIAWESNEVRLFTRGGCCGRGPTLEEDSRPNLYSLPALFAAQARVTPPFVANRQHAKDSPGPSHQSVGLELTEHNLGKVPSEDAAAVAARERAQWAADAAAASRARWLAQRHPTTGESGHVRHPADGHAQLSKGKKETNGATPGSQSEGNVRKGGSKRGQLLT